MAKAWAPRDIHQVANQKGWDNETYPYAKQGLWFLKWTRRLVIAATIILGISMAIEYLHQLLVSEYEGGSLAVDIVNGIGVTAQAVHGAAMAVYGLTAAFFIMYLLLWIMRSHMFEKACFVNDWRALSLRRRLINQLGLSKKIRELKSKQSRQQQFGSNLSGQEITYDERSRLEALRSAKRMKVYMNTRQVLDGTERERRTRIVFDIPDDQKEYEELQNLLKDFDQMATRATHGKAAFGSQLVASDHSSITYSDALLLKEKVRSGKGAQNTSDENVAWEGTFPLTLFVDRTAEIAEVEQKANKWTKDSAAVLDQLWATMKVQATAQDPPYNCAAKSAVYYYKMAFVLDEHQLNSIDETLDKLFDTNGCMAEPLGDTLTVTIPLPKPFRKAIDVPTVLREAFGAPPKEETPVPDAA